MKNRNLIIATCLGFALGFLAKQQIDKYTKISPEKALERAKELFKRSGPISGSWIYMKPEKLEKNGLTYDTYRGGISRNVDGKNEQYEFFSDLETGAIIDVKKMD